MVALPRRGNRNIATKEKPKNALPMPTNYRRMNAKAGNTNKRQCTNQLFKQPGNARWIKAYGADMGIWFMEYVTFIIENGIPCNLKPAIFYVYKGAA